MRELAFLRLRPAKAEDITPEAQAGFLSAYLQTGKRSFFERLLWQSPKNISLELWSINQKTHFYLVSPAGMKGYLSSQIISHYPKTLVEETGDPATSVLNQPELAAGVLRQASYYSLPIKTYKNQTERPMLAAPLGVLAKVKPGETAGIQILLRVPGQTSFLRTIRANMYEKDAEGNEVKSPLATLMEKKAGSPLLECQIRVVYQAENTETAIQKAAEIGGAFGVYTLAEGNVLTYKAVKRRNMTGWRRQVLKRQLNLMGPTMILNTEEAASVWHLPDTTLSYIKTLDWGRAMLSEPPDKLPVAEQYTDEAEKRTVNFFGKTEWHNHESVFGIKAEDRRRHVYIIGKTGAGKSTMIANMAINDIRNGHGVAVIDPHGDLTEMILKYIPKRRVNDVVYLDPTISTDRAFSLNLFDAEGAAHMDVVASGIISVFYKLYHNSWGPRLEYILRNAILSLLYMPNATFADIIQLLTHAGFRRNVVETIRARDALIAGFWTEEFDKMNDKLRMEAISPILNKVGQFLSSQRIRHIVGSAHSSFSLNEVMNDGKILLLNLSQGKLGEDTTALLGAMFITKMQLTAMQRVNVPEDQRRDFYLYVDEFQNFATQSFIKILSEARKYRLNLIMANQYIGQVDEEIQKAIFGNVGTLVTFVVGARDAALLTKEFGQKFTEEELVALGKFEILLKMAIDGLTCEPFFASTLPLPAVVNDNADKILTATMERYYRKTI